MLENAQDVKEISYAHSAQSKGGRTIAKLMENMTGRIGLFKRAKEYQDQIEAGYSFWNVIVERYGLELDVLLGSLPNIPKEGPLIVISNHPYGILDGLMLDRILDETRPDFRILAHKVFKKFEDLNRVILPISFDANKEALEVNLQTQKTALDYLKNGGFKGIFPGVTVSTAATPFSKPMDPNWRAFTARLIIKSNASVVSFYFDGHTSRLFQLASYLHFTLSMGLMINGFRSRVDSKVKVVVGAPMTFQERAPYAGDTRVLMDYLLHKTYELSTNADLELEHGYEFEDKYKS